MAPVSGACVMGIRTEELAYVEFTARSVLSCRSVGSLPFNSQNFVQFIKTARKHNLTPSPTISASSLSLLLASCLFKAKSQR